MFWEKKEKSIYDFLRIHFSYKRREDLKTVWEVVT